MSPGENPNSLDWVTAMFWRWRCLLLRGAVLRLRMVDVRCVIHGLLAVVLIMSCCGDLILKLVSFRVAIVVGGGDVRGVVQWSVRLWLCPTWLVTPFAHPYSWGVLYL
jgi:hypothetical protein